MRVLMLVNGGLDGELAARLLETQGAALEAVGFRTGFEHRPPPSGATIVDVSGAYLREVVLDPRHGYGAAMAPCFDCRVFMLRRADALARERGIEVVATGDVVGQHAHGQHRSAMARIERDAAVGGRWLRPLSARLLPPTAPELDGAIDRGRLEAVHGRSRREQRRLALRFGLDPRRATGRGCCRLADRAFARRLRDLLGHRDADGIAASDVALLAIGRHLRLAHDLKVVAARDAEEGGRLEALAEGRWTARVADSAGAVVVADGDLDAGRRARLAAVAARYSRHRDRERVEVVVRRGEERERFEVAPASAAETAAAAL